MFRLCTDSSSNTRLGYDVMYLSKTIKLNVQYMDINGMYKQA